MNIFELAASKNTAKLNETLNPTIWTKHEHLKNAVKDQILVGAEEYCAYLGLTEAQVNDIVVSGDNASFKYTNESTIDVVVVADLDPDPTFREFFNEHKYKYNGQHQVRVDGHLVQFYVQPADEQFINNGSYSLLRESWVQIPKRTITEDTVSKLQALDLAARPRPQVKKKKKVVQEAIIVTYGFGSDFLDEVGVTPDGVSASTCQFANEEDLNEVGITPDGTNASTCEFANEEVVPTTSVKEEIVQDFVEFCADQLGLEREPNLRIKRDPEWSKRAKTFGRYNPGTNQLEVSLSNRHIMDILRTIAHELTHQHQHEREDVPDHAGETGSEWENEANARAGILMRDYGHSHPELFDHSDELDEGWKNWAAAGLATAALAGAPQAHGQSIQQGLGAIQNIGTAVNTFKGVNWNAMLRSEAGTALYNFILANGGNPNSQNQSSLYQWQKQMQMDQSAQQRQQAQPTQQATTPTTSMYGDQLSQHNARQGVNEATAKSQFNKCYQTAQKLFQQAEKKNLNPVLYQVADYKGDGSQADEAWLKVPQEYWQHYITVVDNVVLDPTARQFGPDKAEKYSIAELQNRWNQIYQILPKETFKESSGYIPTAAQADDPRFEMALTADVRPGATGRAANAFLLNTDAQGHPQQLRADGMVERMIEELELYKKQTIKEDTAISLLKLPKYHKGEDELAKYVPERLTHQFALDPNKWESTFFSLTNKDPRKLKFYGPKKVEIVPGTLIGDMAIANQFYRATTAETKAQFAKQYQETLKPYTGDVTGYRFPELLIPR
jgi:hypothetical protein